MIKYAKLVLSLKFVLSIVFAILIISILCTEQTYALSCSLENTPIIKTDKTTFVLFEGVNFYYDFNLSNIKENGTSYTYSVLSGNITGLEISKSGVISINPGRSDSGESIIAIIAFKDYCVETLVVNITVYTKPLIYDAVPVESNFVINDSDVIFFEVKAKDENSPSLIYRWYLDGALQENASDSKFRIYPEKKLIGRHNMTVHVVNKIGLYRFVSWSFFVTKLNRPPVLTTMLPEISAFKNVETDAYNLNDYFLDPEGGILKFTFRQVLPENDISLNTLKPVNITLNLSSSGFVRIRPETDSTGNAHFVFTAADAFGLSIESNVARINVIDALKILKRNSSQINEFCGDFSCNGLENCTSCQVDCGMCAGSDITGCFPKWNCTGWSSCSPSRIQTRTCFDDNLCGDNRTVPDIMKLCIYNATCSDGLKNGFEEGVDCGGGICKSCATCSDKLQNQGEEDVDCGGPCDACPSCNNNRQDGLESDVDCGGESCKPCLDSQICKVNLDCASFKCAFSSCQTATCTDKIRNSDEEGVDCGGNCVTVCHTCNDGLLNGNEKGVDCGGICDACATCSDGIKNQDEDLIDCGGFNCKTCTFSNYLLTYFYISIALAAILIIGLIAIVTYIFTIPYRPDQAERIFEDRKNFAMLSFAHHFFRFVRVMIGKKPMLKQDAYNSIISKINLFLKKENYSNKELHDTIYLAYSDSMGLPEQFDYRMLARKIRMLKASHFMKIMLVGYFKKSEILITGSFVPSEIRDQLIAELKFLMLELTKP